MNNADSRTLSVDDCINKVKNIISDSVLSRRSLERIQFELVSLAAESAFWLTSEFPVATPPELTTFYLIHQDVESGIALYLNVMSPGERTPIHNHTTWACIASVEGIETNYLYQRIDDGTQPGFAKVIECGVIEVGPEKSIGIFPDDIHAVMNTGSTVVRHLHLYGRPVEELQERLMFDPKNNSCSRMPLITVDDWQK
jgi:predicted metal-dependent enzyme (double-stranded beta helix superfamily)